MTRSVPGPEYESAIMKAHADGEGAPDIKPEEPYEMSQEFQNWLVTTMRDMVMDADNFGSALMGKKD